MSSDRLKIVPAISDPVCWLVDIKGDILEVYPELTTAAQVTDVALEYFESCNVEDHGNGWFTIHDV